jgi:hypothetical protein
MLANRNGDLLPSVPGIGVSIASFMKTIPIRGIR